MQRRADKSTADTENEPADRTGTGTSAETTPVTDRAGAGAGADESTVDEDREEAEMAGLAPDEPAVAERPFDGDETTLDRDEPMPAGDGTVPASDETVLDADETESPAGWTAADADEATLAADETTVDADEATPDTDEATLAADGSTADTDEATLEADGSTADTDWQRHDVVGADRGVDGEPADTAEDRAAAEWPDPADVPPEALAMGVAAGAAGAAGATGAAAAASRTPNGRERVDDAELDDSGTVVAALPAAAVPGSAAELPLIDDEQVDRLRVRWRDVQAAFVDDPDQAVRSAAELLAEALQALTATLADPPGEPGELAGSPRTEELRVELRRYRTAFQRVLGG